MTCEYFWDEKEKLNKISKININPNILFLMVCYDVFCRTGKQRVPAFSRL